MFKEFKEFAVKGNVIDMAVGVIIGAAFGKIVSSVVSDVISPLLGLVTAGINLSALTWIIRPAVMVGGEIAVPEVALAYGNFFQATIDFIIIAFILFLFVRSVNKARALTAEPEVPAPEEPPSPTEAQLLGQILEHLKNSGE